MILIDDQGGSKKRTDEDYYPGLLHSMIPNSMLIRLQAGDVAFSGVGNITIGIELKKLRDAVNCLYTGRLADEQIPKLRESYDVAYLVIEGLWRPEPSTGVLQYFKWFKSEKEVVCGKWVDASSGQKRLTYSAFESWLSTVALLGGLHVRCTPSADTTAALLLSLFNWYQRESHQSYQVMHQAEGNGAALSRPTMLRRDLANLPHVGWERSGILLQRVKGVKFIGLSGNVMTKDDWFIEGQIAEKSAEDIDRACDGQDD